MKKREILNVIGAIIAVVLALLSFFIHDSSMLTGISATESAPDFIFYENNVGTNTDIKYFNGTNFVVTSTPAGTAQSRAMNCETYNNTHVACATWFNNYFYIYKVSGSTVTLASSGNYGGSWGASDVAILNEYKPVIASPTCNNCNTINVSVFNPDGTYNWSQLVGPPTTGGGNMRLNNVYAFNGTEDFAIIGVDDGTAPKSNFIMVYNSSSSTWVINETTTDTVDDWGYNNMMCPDIGNNCIVSIFNQTSASVGEHRYKILYKNNYSLSNEIEVVFSDSNIDNRPVRGRIEMAPVPNTDQIAIYGLPYTGNNYALFFLLNTTTLLSSPVPVAGYPTISSTARYDISGFIDVQHHTMFTDRLNNQVVILFQLSGNKTRFHYNWYDSDTSTYGAATMGGSPDFDNRQAPGVQIVTLKSFANVVENESVISFGDANSDLWSGLEWNGSTLINTQENITGTMQSTADLYYEYVIIDDRPSEAPAGNTAPTLTNFAPSNGTAYDSGTTLIVLNVTYGDAESEAGTVDFRKGDGTLICSNTSVSASSIVGCPYGSLSDGNTYTWYVNASDGTDITTSGVYNFDINNPPVPGSTLLLNLSGGTTSSDLAKDFSPFDYTFDNDGVLWKNKSLCKWYGCHYFSDSMLNVTNEWSFGDEWSYCLWVKYDNTPTTPTDEAVFMFGDYSSWSDVDDFSVTETQYGHGIDADCANGDCGAGSGEANKISAATWTHYCASYDGARSVIWKNSVVVDNNSVPYGNLNQSGYDLVIGRRGGGTQYFTGLLDELIIKNESINSTFVTTLYNLQKDGTPPDYDIYVKNITYDLIAMYDFSTANNSLRGNIGNGLLINITVANAGVNDSDTFTVTTVLNSTTICTNTTSLTGSSETIIGCMWTTEYGMFLGNVTVDVNNDVPEDADASAENNNVQTLFIPVVDRPYALFTYDDWIHNYHPYLSSIKTASQFYDIWYSRDWTSTFEANGFTDGWTGTNCESGCLYAFQNAWTSLMKNHTIASGAFNKSLSHLDGWSNSSVNDWTSVHAVRSFIFLTEAFDIMFQNLTEAEVREWVEGYHRICQKVSASDAADVQVDNLDEIQGDNGKGFGAGMGGGCYIIGGLYPKNPTLIGEVDQGYYARSLVDYWLHRDEGMLQSFKNDSETFYQEGTHYLHYALPFTAHNLIIRDKMGLYPISDLYQNALCSVAKEQMKLVLDDTYKGNITRNDQENQYRSISRGDSNSYGFWDDGGEFKTDTILLYAYLCDDTDIKSAALTFRDRIHNSTTFSYGDITRFKVFLWKDIIDQGGVTTGTLDSVLSKVSFDNADDSLFIRDSYTYINDTVIFIDGGEERGTGHSQAQGYFLYVLGEPFIDYEQVPLEDDVRMDVWKNGISIQNMTQTDEGTGGFFLSACGEYGKNQYFGMQDCDTPLYSTHYPDYREFPLQYGGDMEDYLGVNDSSFAGIHVWRPYYNASIVDEYFIKWGDVLIKRTLVNDSVQNEGVWHNFINLYNESTMTVSGTNFLLNATNNITKQNIFVNTSILHDSSGGAVLGGSGPTGLRASRTKTGSATLFPVYRRAFYYTTDNDWDLVFAHSWGVDVTGPKTVASIANNDEGVTYDSNYIVLFDSDEDEDINYSSKNAKGWGLVYNDARGEIGAFNTTHIDYDGIDLLTANESLEAFFEINSDVIRIWINTMDDISTPGYDVQKVVNITVDAQNLTNNSNFAVNRNDLASISATESGTKVTFLVFGAQTPTYYEITGGEEITDTTAPAVLTVTAEALTNTGFRVDLTLNESGNATVYVSTDSGLASPTAYDSTSYTTVHNITIDSLTNDTEYFWQVNGSDADGNWYTTAITSNTTLSNEGLLLNGVAGSLTYEATTTAEINATSASTGISLDVNNYKNFTFSSGSTFSLDFPVVPFLYRFNDSAQFKVFANKAVNYILLSNYSYLLNASVTIESDAPEYSEPRDVSIDIGNDGTVDYILLGRLGTNYLKIDRFSNNLTTETFTFPFSQYSILRYITIPIEDGWTWRLELNMSGENIEGNLTETFDTTVYKDSDTTTAIWNTTDEFEIAEQSYNIHKEWKDGGGDWYMHSSNDNCATDADFDGALKINAVYDNMTELLDNDPNSYFFFHDCTVGDAGEGPYCSSTYWYDSHKYYNIYNVTANNTLNLEFFFSLWCHGALGAECGGNVSIYNFNNNTWESIYSTGMIPSSTAQYIVTTSDPASVPFYVYDKYINESQNNRLYVRFENLLKCKGYTGSQFIWKGYGLFEDYDMTGFTPEYENREIIQTVKIGEPTENITDVYFTMNASLNSDVLVELTADDETWDEIEFNIRHDALPYRTANISSAHTFNATHPITNVNDGILNTTEGAYIPTSAGDKIIYMNLTSAAVITDVYLVGVGDYVSAFCPFTYNVHLQNTSAPDDESVLLGSDYYDGGLDSLNYQSLEFHNLSIEADSIKVNFTGYGGVCNSSGLAELIVGTTSDTIPLAYDYKWNFTVPGNTYILEGFEDSTVNSSFYSYRDSYYTPTYSGGEVFFNGYTSGDYYYIGISLTNITDPFTFRMKGNVSTNQVPTRGEAMLTIYRLDIPTTGLSSAQYYDSYANYLAAAGITSGPSFNIKMKDSVGTFTNQSWSGASYDVAYIYQVETNKDGINITILNSSEYVMANMWKSHEEFYNNSATSKYQIIIGDPHVSVLKDFSMDYATFNGTPNTPIKKTLKARLNLWSQPNMYDTQSVVYDFTLGNLTFDYPYNLSIDVGDDGVLEYENYSIINSTFVIDDSVTNVTLGSGISSYYLNNCINNSIFDGCLVPIRFRTEKPGTLIINELNASPEDSENEPLFDIRRMINITPFVDLVDADPTTIPINISWYDGVGYNVNVTTIRVYHYGNDTITLTLQPDAVTQYIYVEYDPFNVTLPENVDGFWIFPLSLDQDDIEPFGQKASKYEPFYTIDLIQRPGQDTNITINMNDTSIVPRCVNITYRVGNTSVSPEVLSDETIVNKCRVIERGKYESDDDMKVYMYVDLNACAANDVYYFDPVFFINSICTDCVQAEDYCS